MKTYRDSLAALLSADEIAPVDALVAGAPTNATFGHWMPERGLVLVGAVLDGALAGWLMVPAADAVEAQALAEALAEGLARCYGPMRDARAATELLLRRLAH